MTPFAKHYTTTYCHTPMFGYGLRPGDVLEPDDVFDSTSGEWQTLEHRSGETMVGGNNVCWVRPFTFDTQCEHCKRHVDHTGAGERVQCSCGTAVCAECARQRNDDYWCSPECAIASDP